MCKFYVQLLGSKIVLWVAIVFYFFDIFYRKLRKSLWTRRISRDRRGRVVPQATQCLHWLQLRRKGTISLSFETLTLCSILHKRWELEMLKIPQKWNVPLKFYMVCVRATRISCWAFNVQRDSEAIVAVFCLFVSVVDGATSGTLFLLHLLVRSIICVDKYRTSLRRRRIDSDVMSSSWDMWAVCHAVQCSRQHRCQNEIWCVLRHRHRASDLLWVDKYKPVTRADLVGNPNLVNHMRKFLNTWCAHCAFPYLFDTMFLLSSCFKLVPYLFIARTNRQCLSCTFPRRPTAPFLVFLRVYNVLVPAQSFCIFERQSFDRLWSILTLRIVGLLVF